MKLEPIRVNSDSSAGMKILEIAFIKESILSNPKLENLGKTDLNNIEINEEAIKRHNLSDTHVSILK
jgi:hypothetical protein